MTTYLSFDTAFDCTAESQSILPPPPPPPPRYRRVKLVQEPDRSVKTNGSSNMWAKAIRMHNVVRGWVQTKLIGQKYEHAWLWLIMFFMYVSVVVIMFTRINSRLSGIETCLREITMASARATLFGS